MVIFEKKPSNKKNPNYLWMKPNFAIKTQERVNVYLRRKKYGRYWNSNPPPPGLPIVVTVDTFVILDSNYSADWNSALHGHFQKKEKTPTTELNIFLPKKIWLENNNEGETGIKMNKQYPPLTCSGSNSTKLTDKNNTEAKLC